MDRKEALEEKKICVAACKKACDEAITAQKNSLKFLDIFKEYQDETTALFNEVRSSALKAANEVNLKATISAAFKEVKGKKTGYISVDTLFFENLKEGDRLLPSLLKA